MAYEFEGYRGMSMDMKAAAGATTGGLIGALQTMLLREYADNSMATSFLKNTSGTPPLLMKQLKGFGSPSALGGIIGGAIGLTIGLFGLLKRKLVKDVGIASALTSYGATALTTGVLSGALPTVQWSSATAADPNNPIGAPAIQRAKQSDQLQIARSNSPLVTLGA